MSARFKCAWPKITRAESIIWLAILVSALCSACGGRGSTDSSFFLSVNVVNPGETMADWPAYPVSNTFRVFRDGQQITRALGDVAYTDRGLQTGARYCYVVRARSPLGEFDASSNEVCVTMPAVDSGQIEALDAGKTARIPIDFTAVPCLSELNGTDVLVAYDRDGRRARTVIERSLANREEIVSGSSGLSNVGGFPMQVTYLPLLLQKRQYAKMSLG